LVNRCPACAAESGSLGFEFVEIDGSIANEAVA
jgi:hypothetical protein